VHESGSVLSIYFHKSRVGYSSPEEYLSHVRYRDVGATGGAYEVHEGGLALHYGEICFDMFL